MFGTFVDQVLRACFLPAGQITRREASFLTFFLIRLFGALELDLVVQEIKPLFTVSSWCELPEDRREAELSQNPKLQKLWKKATKQLAGLSDAERERVTFKHTFLWRYLQQFGSLVSSLQPPFAAADIEYCARAMELFIDLEVCGQKRKRKEKEKKKKKRRERTREKKRKKKRTKRGKSDRLHLRKKFQTGEMKRRRKLYGFLCMFFFPAVAPPFSSFFYSLFFILLLHSSSSSSFLLLCFFFFFFFDARHFRRWH